MIPRTLGHAVFPVPVKPFHDEVGRGHGDGQSDFGVIRGCGQRKHAGGGGSGDPNLFHPQAFQERNGLPEPLKGKIVMAVILFAGRHAQGMASVFDHPGCAAAGHIVLGGVAQHQDDGFSALLGTAVIGADEPVFFKRKDLFFHGQYLLHNGLGKPNYGSKEKPTSGRRGDKC